MSCPEKFCFVILLSFALHQAAFTCSVIQEDDLLPTSDTLESITCNSLIDVKLYSLKNMKIIIDIVSKLNRHMSMEDYKPEMLCDVNVITGWYGLGKKLSASNLSLMDFDGLFFTFGLWNQVCGPAPLYLNIVKKYGQALTEFVLLEIQQCEMRHQLLMFITYEKRSEMFDKNPSDNIVSMLTWCNILPNNQKTSCRKREKLDTHWNKEFYYVIASLNDWKGEKHEKMLQIVEETWLEYGECPLDQLRKQFECYWNASWQFVCGRPVITTRGFSHGYVDESGPDDFIDVDVRLMNRYGGIQNLISRFALMVYRTSPIIMKTHSERDVLEAEYSSRKK